eukprot:5874028-Amphidinium_carterae.1
MLSIHSRVFFASGLVCSKTVELFAAMARTCNVAVLVPKMRAGSPHDSVQELAIPKFANKGLHRLPFCL